jgi:CheY-like chemotaxis protein
MVPGENLSSNKYRSAQMSKTILLVDDSSTTRVAHRIAIGRHTTSKILCASNGEEALEKAYSEKPDLILMDVIMPGMSGLDVCRALRKNPLTKWLPVILLTYRSKSQSVEDGYASGCTEYLMKPLQDAELVRILRTYLISE